MDDLHMNQIEKEKNVLCIVRGAECFVFLYEDHQQTELLRRFGRLASRPDLTFSWKDAARLAIHVKNLNSEQGGQPAR
jgi:hypothetical protein